MHGFLGNAPLLPLLYSAQSLRDGIILSPRPGELYQYSYLHYDTQAISLSEAHIYPEPAGTDPFHREPYLVVMDAGDFDAVLAVIHTDPDEASDEMNALSDVIAYVCAKYPGKPQIVVMGDFNADGSYFKENGPCTLKSSEFVWLIGSDVDTMISSTDCMYERIFITDDTGQYFTGDAGVYRFDTVYGLTVEETKAGSDHYPVYAVISTGGGSGPVILTTKLTAAPSTVQMTKATMVPTTRTPTPTPTASSSTGVWDCSHDAYNCGDFSCQADA